MLKMLIISNGWSIKCGKRGITLTLILDLIINALYLKKFLSHIRDKTKTQFTKKENQIGD